MNKKYMLRDATGYFFQSVSGDGDEAHFTACEDDAYKFSKDEMASFRRDYDYIKGRVILASQPKPTKGSK